MNTGGVQVSSGPPHERGARPSRSIAYRPARKWSNKQNKRLGFGEVRRHLVAKARALPSRADRTHSQSLVVGRGCDIRTGSPLLDEPYGEVLKFKLAVRELRVALNLQQRRDLKHHGLHALLVVLFQ